MCMRGTFCLGSRITLIAAALWPVGGRPRRIVVDGIIEGSITTSLVGEDSKLIRLVVGDGMG
jgi:hypothetical protein